MDLIIYIDFCISLCLHPYRDGLSLNLTRAANLKIFYPMDGSKLNEGENNIPKLLNMTLTWPDLRANGSDGIDVSYGLWIEQFLTLPTPLSLFRNHTENTSTAHQSKSLPVGTCLNYLVGGIFPKVFSKFCLLEVLLACTYTGQRKLMFYKVVVKTNSHLRVFHRCLSGWS